MPPYCVECVRRNRDRMDARETVAENLGIIRVFSSMLSTNVRVSIEERSDCARTLARFMVLGICNSNYAGANTYESSSGANMFCVSF